MIQIAPVVAGLLRYGRELGAQSLVAGVAQIEAAHMSFTVEDNRGRDGQDADAIDQVRMVEGRDRAHCDRLAERSAESRQCRRLARAALGAGWC